MDSYDSIDFEMEENNVYEIFDEFLEEVPIQEYQSNEEQNFTDEEIDQEIQDNDVDDMVDDFLDQDFDDGTK